MPVPADIVEHLLRRTEYVARPARVDELKNLANLDAAVDNVLAVPADPGSVTLTEPTDWQRLEQYTHYWMNRMAHDSPRPIQEKISFFLHGHFCSEASKVNSAYLMQEQIDLFRREGMGSIWLLAKKMAVQVAMLRYLDNNDNRKSSPNQNFGRELLELFLLGVGNYTEADVEASAAAWTGHTDDWATGAYVWRPEWHDQNPKSFLGRTINTDASPGAQISHGYEVVDTVFTNGIVPAGPNAGRDTRAVAAEFLSKKLWLFFAGSTPSQAVINALRDVAIANSFAIKPWVRALLLRPEFYDTAARQGLVRSPVDFVVTGLVASGLRSEDGTAFWQMDGMGQRPLYPPNVSGWKHNGYFVSASAMASRTYAAQVMFWNLAGTYWDPGGAVTLPGGTITREQITGDPGIAPHALVDTFLSMMRLTPSDQTRNALYAFADSTNKWERINMLWLIFLIPEMHVA